MCGEERGWGNESGLREFDVGGFGVVDSRGGFVHNALRVTLVLEVLG